MLKHILLREEDYWLVPVSFFAVLFVGLCLYAGSIQIRLLSGLVGFSGLWFLYHIIRRGYNATHAGIHILLCLVGAVLGALGMFVLTN